MTAHACPTPIHPSGPPAAGRGRLPAGSLLSALGLAAALLVGGCSGSTGEPQGLVVLPGSTQAPNPEGTGATVERPFFHDFGDVPWGEVVSHTFVLENTESLPISIRRVTPGCSCTVAKLEALDADGSRVEGRPEDPDRLLVIPAGGRAEVGLKIDTDGRDVQSNVDKLVNVRIMTDSELTPFLQLELHLKVVRMIEAAPQELTLPRASHHIGVRDSVLLRSLDAGRAWPSEVVQTPDGVEVDLYLDPSSSSPDRWLLDARVLPAEGPRSVEGRIAVATETPHGPGPTVYIPLRCELVPDLSVEPPRLVLRPSAGGALPSRAADLFLRLPGRSFRVLSARLEGEGKEWLEIDAVPSQPAADGTSSAWSVELNVTEAPAAAEFSGTIELRLQGAGQDAEAITEASIPYDGLFPPASTAQ